LPTSSFGRILERSNELLLVSMIEVYDAPIPEESQPIETRCPTVLGRA
jgi:hypothetical protein